MQARPEHTGWRNSTIMQARRGVRFRMARRFP